ncbi:MAG TPA: response regulator [Flavobacteriales bacterium]|nr:response regulator [Flavobacteriales bacterium]
MELINKRIKVLYVDDEEGNLMAFRASFRREFDVHVAISAADALAWLEENPVHVVISDQRMPGMTGSEFLAIVRKRWPRSVRLLLTGFSDIEAVVDAINLGGIHAYITKPWDPTDLKLRVEQAYEVHSLRDQRDKLLDRYRQIFESSGDPILILDDQGKFKELNTAARHLLRLERTAPLPDLSTYVQDVPAMFRRMRQHRRGVAYKNVDITLAIPNGPLMDCLVTATHMGKSGEKRSLYQVILKDITDRKKQEEHLKKLNSDLDKRVAIRTKQLLEALDDLGAFSYSVAHDLRSPLKNIKVMSEHLSSMALLRNDEEERDMSERIHKGVTRLIALVDDLLRFSRTDSMETTFTDLDIRETLNECIDEHGISPHKVKFILPEPGQAIIHADPAMIKVVLNNLLANAIKFTKKRDVARIEVGHAREGDTDVVWMKDNGVGFDAQKKDQLFGVFKRLHSTSQFEGTGIGLALVDRIMKKHNGSCWAEGAPDSGATIYLRFPAAHQTMRQAG